MDSGALATLPGPLAREHGQSEQVKYGQTPFSAIGCGKTGIIAASVASMIIVTIGNLLGTEMSLP